VWVGDRLWTGKPHRCRTRHRGLLSVSLLSVAGCNEYLAKAGQINRHITWYTIPYPWSRSVVLVPGCMSWLAEISADLREAVAHMRHVCNDALYKSTVRYVTMHCSYTWCYLSIALQCCDKTTEHRIWQLLSSASFWRTSFIRCCTPTSASMVWHLTTCRRSVSRSQLSPVDRISALLTVSSSWCPGRIQSRSDHVLSARLALCLGTLFLSASEILAWHCLLSGSSWRHSCLTFDIVLVGHCTRLCDYLVNCAFEMLVYYYYYYWAGTVLGLDTCGYMCPSVCDSVHGFIPQNCPIYFRPQCSWRVSIVCYTFEVERWRSRMQNAEISFCHSNLLWIKTKMCKFRGQVCLLCPSLHIFCSTLNLKVFIKNFISIEIV